NPTKQVGGGGGGGGENTKEEGRKGGDSTNFGVNAKTRADTPTFFFLRRPALRICDNSSTYDQSTWAPPTPPAQ
ncbi:hypothetical protein WG66_014522, partial [Moniliophthora roreri]